MDHFFDESFNKQIIHVIREEFPSLPLSEIEYLGDKTINLIDYISYAFNFDKLKKDQYEHQFKQNNYQDAKGILYMLLPFINDESGNDKKKLYKLADLIILKKDDKVYDINKEEPKYLLTNYQYNYFKKDLFGYTERPFSLELIDMNYELLKLTITKISNHLMPNWIDVIPISPDAINELQIFTEMKKYIYTGTLYNIEGDMKSIPIGMMQMNELYETIYHQFYFNIKNHKWLIYEYTDENNVYPFVYGLSKLFDFEKILNNEWNELNDTDQNMITQQWEKIKASANGSMSMNGVPTIALKKIAISIILFFNMYYKRLFTEDYKSIGDLDKEDDNKELNENDSKFRDILSTESSKIPTESLYNFIKEEIEKFKISFYGIKLMDGINVKRSSEIALTDMTLGKTRLQVTCKNLYNFAKLISVKEFKENNYTDNIEKHVYYPKYWDLFSASDVKTVSDRLSMSVKEDPREWFNISQNLRIVYQIKDESVLKNMHIALHQTIRYELARFIFESMAYRGILTQFIPQQKITDEKLLPVDFTDKMRYIKLQQQSLVFNNPPIRKLFNNANYFLTKEKYGNMLIDKYSGGTIVKKNYYDYINDQTWSTMFAMNWISQIRFFHGFINNTVMFITGATGAGKSTQVPKLYLYGEMFLHHNDSPKIICTQPRKNATQNTAIRISEEMAVPIAIKKKIGTKEIEESIDNYYIQFKHQDRKHTRNNIDKPMLKFVTDGTLLQEMTNPLMKRKVKDYYTTRNIYDAMMVDESHEHNANMDLILTLFRNIAFYNNTIRFGIISATMDDDEPSYRSFYRCINDNLTYPMNSLDFYERISVDRRYHISPPGKATRFPIKEVYHPMKSVEEVTLELINKTHSGDILVFQPGEGRIKEVVTYLNQNTPSNVIALGYFGNIGDKFKELIETVDKNKLLINIPKDYDMKADYDEIPKINHVYTRVIIVATNIAEASITISSLRYVVDDGMQKIGEYNYITESTVQKETNISESSRRQRKGRVGRVSWGEFHATYPEKHKESIKTYFNISLSDISESILRLLQENPSEGELIPINLIPLYDSYKSESYLISIKNGIGKIILDSRYVNGIPISYESTDHNLIHEQIPPPFYKETGYSLVDLLDLSGKFYIVHPEERTLIRNINRDIMNKIISPKMESFILKLEKMGFITKDRNKTEFGTKILDIKDQIGFEDMRFLLSYLLGRINNCHMEILYGYLVMQLTRGDLTRLISKFKDSLGRFKSYLPEIRKLYGDNFSDLTAIKRIIDKLFNDFRLQLFSNRTEIKGQVSKIMRLNITDNRLNSMIENDDLLIMYKEYIKSIPEINIEQWTTYNKIDGKLIKQILEMGVMLNINLMKLSIGKEKLLDWFDKKFSKFKFEGYQHEKLAYSLLYGFSNRIYRSIGTKNLGIMLSYPSPEYILQIKQISPKLSIPVNLLKEDQLFGYLIFLNYQFDEEYDDSRTVSMLTKIKPELIKKAGFIDLSEEDFKKKMDRAKQDVTKILDELEKYKTSKIYYYQPTILNKYFETLKKIPSELGLPLESKHIQVGGKNEKIDITKYYLINYYLFS